MDRCLRCLMLLYCVYLDVIVGSIEVNTKCTNDIIV